MDANFSRSSCSNPLGVKAAIAETEPSLCSSHSLRNERES
jgi:hypothetical protein